VAALVVHPDADGVAAFQELVRALPSRIVSTVLTSAMQE
jgi:hypothetical protein